MQIYNLLNPTVQHTDPYAEMKMKQAEPPLTSHVLARGVHHIPAPHPTHIINVLNLVHIWFCLKVKNLLKYNHLLLFFIKQP